jgi:hypothetical protein
MSIIHKARDTELSKQAQKVFLIYNGCNAMDRQLTD